MSGRTVCGLGLAVMVHGGAWAQVPAGGEFRVNTYTTTRQWQPAVAAAPGGFVVVWDSEDQGGYGTGVFGQRYDAAGLARGAEFRISTRDDEFVQFSEKASVAMASDGRFVAVWEDDRGGIFARRYTAVGTPLGPDFSVNTSNSLLREDPEVASIGADGFVVVWVDANAPGGTGILGRRYDTSGIPSGAEFQVNTVPLWSPQHPDVAAGADGRFVVTWSGSTSDDVFARRYDSAGNPVGAEFVVNGETAGLQQYAAVGMAPGGNFVVVWRSSEATWSIVGQRFDAAGVRVGAEFTVSEDTNNSFPAVSMAAESGFAVVWETSNGFDVFGRRYDASGQPEGPAFRVNTYTTDFQDQPAVAAMPDGAFVVVWTSVDAPYSGGVFGQRYRAPNLIFAGWVRVVSPAETRARSPAASGGPAHRCSLRSKPRWPA
jgi:hypothetical protein